MKRARVLAVALLGAGLIIACQPPESGGGGGGLFGGGGGAGALEETWDMMFLIAGNTACAKGFPGRGAMLDPSLPAGYFPGLIVQSSATEYDADVPEVKILGYFLGVPEMVPGGQSVHVHFVYEAHADGEDGDYFLARIIDGDRFLVPARETKTRMSAGRSKAVDYTYTTREEGFGLEFIVGLSGPADVFYLDELQVSAGGAPLFADHFESGAYNVPGQVNQVVMRSPFLPASAAGTVGLQPDLVLEGAQSLMFTGGSYFQLYGQGASTEGVDALVLTYNDPDYLDPFFGQTQATLQGGIYMGDYLAFDNATVPTCTEQGSVTIAVNPSGNADLSGTWLLQLEGLCASGLPFQEVVPGPVQVARQMIMFVAAPFNTSTGVLVDKLQGLSMGEMGMFTMASTAAGSQAQLMGTYDRVSGVFAGQVTGTLPGCTVAQGQFAAVINGAAPATGQGGSGTIE